MKNPENNEIISSSFRDPSGFLFYRDNSIYRQVNVIYKEHYDYFMNSGLYRSLVDAELLIPHEEVAIPSSRPDMAYKIIQPEPIPFISYPYEWCFSQLKNAAITTLEIQKKALDSGMSLKDCSAYNIQFRKGTPVLIDTLSFEKHLEGHPWVAYRQFCQHFLAPLALMNYKDIRLNQLFRIYIDGVPLDLASSLLPLVTRFRFPLLSHIHLHAKSQKYFADKPLNTNNHKMSRYGLIGLVDNLKHLVESLKRAPANTEWSNYYQDNNYSPEAFQYKKQIVYEFLDKIKPKNVWDLGANTGIFSRIAGDKGIMTISFDGDPAAVEINYLQCCKKHETNILPLLLDLTNPSPDIGWQNQERTSFLNRGPADTVLALALIHHLTISNNVPLNKSARFFSNICNSLIIEFIPKTDSQVQTLFPVTRNCFPDYTQEVFENSFYDYFTIQESIKIRDSERILYLMVKKQPC